MEARIIIDGREYPMPDLNQITMGQARVIKRYTGMSLEQVASGDPSDPDLIAAFCHLAIQQGDPGKSFAQIEREVEAIAFSKLEFAGGDQELPPASTPSETESEPTGSGEASAAPSDETPATILPLTGTQD